MPPLIYVNPTTASCTGVGYPLSYEATDKGVTTDYSCKRGTAFVYGVVKGQVTVAAKDDVVVTGDLTYANDGSDTNVTGLVAGNYVWVYHPVKSNEANLLSSSSAVHNIQAAILSLRHSFLVQNWNLGDPIGPSSGTKLNVVGAIAQKYRGPVGTGNGNTASSGYLKDYVYDNRLKALQPPYFLKPVSSPWEATTSPTSDAASVGCAVGGASLLTAREKRCWSPSSPSRPWSAWPSVRSSTSSSGACRG